MSLTVTVATMSDILWLAGQRTSRFSVTVIVGGVVSTTVT